MLHIHMPANHRFRFFKQFISNATGITTVEMALIAPFLFLLSIGTIEIGMVIFTNVVVEGATTTAARTAKTGAQVGKVSREEYIRSEVLRRSAGLLDIDKLSFSMNVYEDTDPKPGLGSAGGSGDIVVMTVSYPWDVITPLAGAIVGDPYMVSSEITFRNEPF